MTASASASVGVATASMEASASATVGGGGESNSKSTLSQTSTSSSEESRTDTTEKEVTWTFTVSLFALASHPGSSRTILAALHCAVLCTFSFVFFQIPSGSGIEVYQLKAACGPYQLGTTNYQILNMDKCRPWDGWELITTFDNTDGT